MLLDSLAAKPALDDSRLTPETRATLQRVRTLARLLDGAVGIPGTRMRLGLDAVLGLIPGVGDVAGALLSGWIVLTAARLGVPRATLARMLGNIVADTAVGAIPVLGDVFDVTWRSNQRNAALVERHLLRDETHAVGARGRSVLIGVVLVALAVGIGALAWYGTAAIVALLRR